MQRSTNYHCNICNHNTQQADTNDLGEIKGNTAKYHEQSFPLWRCPQCKTIHSLEPVNFSEIYADYPLNHMRKLDIYARRTLNNLLKRLLTGGINKKSHILDYGCGNGVFSAFLKKRGYQNIDNYDPYVEPFSQEPTKQYDLVVLNDVLEHVEEPSKLLDSAAHFVKQNGLLYVGTADSAGVGSMNDLEQHRMRLHQPFHRKIITQNILLLMGQERNFHELAVYTRSYMDTLFPFGNYRFLDEYNAALGHNMDLALMPESASIIIKRPKVLLYAFIGYFFPSAEEPAVLWRIH